MILVFGGSSQGKLDFALLTYGNTPEQVLTCTGTTLSLIDDHKVIYGVEKFVLNCIRNDIDPLNYLMENIQSLKSKILICNDISSGVVPMAEENRKWCQQNGKCLQYLSSQSSTVYRIFCGLPMVLKDEQ